MAVIQMSERRRGWHWRERPVTFVWVVLQFPGELWRSVRGYVSFPRSLVAERSSGVSNVLYRLGWWGPGDACASLCPRPGGVGPMAAAVATHRYAPRPSRHPRLQADRVGKVCRLEGGVASRPLGSSVH